MVEIVGPDLMRDRELICLTASRQSPENKGYSQLPLNQLTLLVILQSRSEKHIVPVVPSVAPYCKVVMVYTVNPGHKQIRTKSRPRILSGSKNQTLMLIQTWRQTEKSKNLAAR